ncbi:MAG TPA: hypothetical protein VK666_27650 [Chryseolinea sp.]|nr:hypothetical protein [Chryseolinea sp.]
MIKRTIYYISHWEVWHWFAKYVFIGPAWLWLCLRARSFWFFTTSNPTITFGGFIGESKSEIYKQLPVGTYPLSVYAHPNDDLIDVINELTTIGLKFPLAVKPDIGMMGFMFRRIDSVDQLKQYHRAMPTRYIIQELIDHPVEVSVFYYRFPGKDTGHISGFIRKEFMQVTGDGVQTLEQLILNYPRAQFRLKELFSKHESKLKTVIQDGERFYLSYALNLSRGGRLISLEHEKDEKLLNIFDGLSQHSKSFYYGRYDIKCRSIDDLKAGKNFSILEYNGCGAEPHHVYGNGLTFFEACAILVEHWKILFKISQINFLNGVPRWTHAEGKAFSKTAREHFKVLKQLDMDFEFDKPAIQTAYADKLGDRFPAPAFTTQENFI